MNALKPDKSKSPVIEQLFEENNATDLYARGIAIGNILKHVHFESIDTTDNSSPIHSRHPSPPKFTQTYTVHQFDPVLKPMPSGGFSNVQDQENKTNRAAGLSTAAKTTIKNSKVTTRIPQQITGGKSSGLVDNKKLPSALKSSPLKQTTNKIHSTRPVLTFQQKRQIEQEKREKFERDVLSIRQKIVVRKFGYAWLRLYYYSKRMTYRPLLLPSQTE
jgi:hypothetical protein